MLLSDPASRFRLLAVGAIIALLLPARGASACDGQTYTFDIKVGAAVSGGGLIVRLDKMKLYDDIVDKYYISVKDEGQILADHVVVRQHSTINLKTRCGIVSIGADRKSVFNSSTLTLNWSYF